MNTYNTTLSKIKRTWYLFDLKGQILGRAASVMAYKLIGKNKTYYSPHLDCGDYVVAINASRIKVTGKKVKNKVYAKHSNYPGGFREITLAQQLAKDPRQVIIAAVKGMLPVNKLRADRLARLKVFIGDQHPYQDKMTGIQNEKMEEKKPKQKNAPARKK